MVYSYNLCHHLKIPANDRCHEFQIYIKEKNNKNFYHFVYCDIFSNTVLANDLTKQNTFVMIFINTIIVNTMVLY